MRLFPREKYLRWIRGFYDAANIIEDITDVCEYVLSPAPSLKIPSLRLLHYRSRI